MATPVVMEALSPTMEEGRLVKWHKREGDAVTSGETLAEVETDKAIMDIVARADGVLRRVVATEGQAVPVGGVLAEIAGTGEPLGPDAPRATAPEALGSGPPDRGPAPPPSAWGAAPRPAAASPAAPAVAGGDRVKASPLAKRIAKEAGVDLAHVVGSGPGGRVVKRDLDAAAHVPGAMPAPPPVSPAPPVLPPAPSGPPARAARPETARGGPAYEDVPLTQIRRTIAKRLATSLGPIPHFFLTTEVDMERAAEARTALNVQLGDQERIGFNDIVLKAVALALGRHRACNAWFQDDHIRYWNEVHLGMAVAVADGLITPVIRDADTKSLSQLGREARALADKARSRRLAPEEYTGSTFTVSNLGMFDVDQFTAVINPPEAAILAVGSIVPKPVVQDDRVTARRRVRLTLSCDHRVIDGATGAAFLQTLKLMLENPLAMVL